MMNPRFHTVKVKHVRAGKSYIHFTVFDGAHTDCARRATVSSALPSLVNCLRDAIFCPPQSLIKYIIVVR